MAQIINATEAMQVLQDHFGERLDSSRDEGIDQMAEVLKNKFSLSGRDAKEVVKDLEAARSIRWVENTSDQSAGVTGTVRAETPGPLPITAVGNGYWDLVH